MTPADEINPDNPMSETAEQRRQRTLDNLERSLDGLSVDELFQVLGYATYLRDQSDR